MIHLENGLILGLPSQIDTRDPVVWPKADIYITDLGEITNPSSISYDLAIGQFTAPNPTLRSSTISILEERHLLLCMGTSCPATSDVLSNIDLDFILLDFPNAATPELIAYIYQRRTDDHDASAVLIEKLVLSKMNDGKWTLKNQYTLL